MTIIQDVLFGNDTILKLLESNMRIQLPPVMEGDHLGVEWVEVVLVSFLIRHTPHGVPWWPRFDTWSPSHWASFVTLNRRVRRKNEKTAWRTHHVSVINICGLKMNKYKKKCQNRALTFKVVSWFVVSWFPEVAFGVQLLEDSKVDTVTYPWWPDDGSLHSA